MTTILVVDDDADIRLLAHVLLDARGFSVEEAGDGPSALIALRGVILPALVLLDIRMPAPDGLEVLDIIRSEGIPVKVVMISAHAGPEMYEDALSRRADAFVLKPFTPTDLYETIDRVLGEAVA